MAFSAEAALDLFRQAHAQERLAHAYLLAGPAESGKRRLASGLCEIVHGAKEEPFRHEDVHLVEPESKSRRIVVAQVRELERALQMRSSRGGRKVGIIFDADRLVEAASNAFLKTLEEPPQNCLLLLLTAMPELLPDTILSRCIEVPLRSAGVRQRSPAEARLVSALQDYSRHTTHDLPKVFSLVREFLDVLAEAKEAVATEHAAALKAEEQRYKQTTDGKWLAEREDYYKALSEARYVEARTQLLQTLELWWADVLRQKHGGATLDYPDCSTETAALAERCTTSELLRKTAALEELRDHLGRNIQEQLGVEVAFLKAFGD